MNGNIILTQRVLQNIRRLPADEQTQIADAIAREILLGAGSDVTLSPTAEIIYPIIRCSIERDSQRFSGLLGA